MRSFLVSVIVPLKKIESSFRRETIPALLNQSYSNFEIIILPDHRFKGSFPKTKIVATGAEVGPAKKRNLGVEKAKGEIVAFIDDDAYPGKEWLENGLVYFQPQATKDGQIGCFQKIAAVCGPGVTPSNDPLRAQVSGWMWSSWLGAGGAGTYRCRPGRIREVDDYPTFNLLVRKEDFLKVGGFDPHFWPGEDTKLCHDLVYKLGKKIIYDPKILVYHHRRPIFIPHLKQIGRYGLHRGYFVRILPKTSRRLGYFIPSFFALGILLGPLFYLFFRWMGEEGAKILINSYFFILGLYGFLLFLTSFKVFLKSKNILVSLLLIPTIFISHFFYGLMFLRGLTKRKLKSRFGREKI